MSDLIHLRRISVSALSDAWSRSEQQRGEERLAEQTQWRSEHGSTYRRAWETWICVAGAPASFPRLQLVAEDATSDPHYYSRGDLRWYETHCFFNYTLQGSGFFQDARGRHRLEAGTGFICTIDDPQTAYGYGEYAGEEWRFLSVCLGGEAARLMVQDLVRSHGALFKIAPDAAILRQLRELRQDDDDMLQMPLAPAVELAYSLLMTLEQSTQRPHEENAEMLVQRAIQKLASQSNLSSVGDLADSLNVSREHLSRVFRNHIGISPRQWIERERIRRACRLLQTTELTNKQIAYRLGYSQTPTFVRAFNRAMKTTPRHFRRQMQEIAAIEKIA